MKTGVYLCNCGNSFSERIDFGQVTLQLEQCPGVAYIKPIDFLCSDEGKQWFEADLKKEQPDRVVVAACSPREYESTFMGVLRQAGINPYFLQMVNIREQVAWMTPDAEQATRKAAAQIRAAIARVKEHQPLEKMELEVCRDVLVVGAGPAGLKSALTLAEGGHKVVLVEKSPAIGGLTVLYEELFPNLECGPCLLEPVEGEVMHGVHASNIDILTMAQMASVTGYYGNFKVKIQQSARRVNLDKCIGCGECIAPCPSLTANEFSFHLGQRNAIAFPFMGALPNVPFVDEKSCLRWKGESCTLCRDACPVEDTIRFDEEPRTFERTFGAIVVAVGSGLYDCRQLPELGYGTVPGVHTSLEFERILASNGPTSGELRSLDGATPNSIAIVQCVGSLDPQHRSYCSGVCCQYAFKFNHLIEKKLPGTKIHHFYKELVMPGKEGFSLYQHAKHNPNATFHRYDASSALQVSGREGKAAVEFRDASGQRHSVAADMVVLCPALTGTADSEEIGRLLDAPRDAFGFFEELNAKLDSAQSRIKGVYLAGACQAPMNIQGAVSQGMAAASYVLAGLPEGRKLEIEPITAAVDEARCSQCRTCGRVCPYKAISYPPDRDSAYVNALLCHGCGTCVAACPAGVIRGNHFTNEQIVAELEALLQ